VLPELEKEPWAHELLERLVQAQADEMEVQVGMYFQKRAKQ
jgi:hypothetical protein